MTKEEAIAALTKANAVLDGGTGISWSQGESHIRRYDSDTGEPYTYSRPASMTLSSSKLTAIVDLYRALPEIVAALSQNWDRK